MESREQSKNSSLGGKLYDLRVDQLRKVLGALGKPKYGNKQNLVDRLWLVIEEESIQWARILELAGVSEDLNEEVQEGDGEQSQQVEDTIGGGEAGELWKTAARDLRAVEGHKQSSAAEKGISSQGDGAAGTRRVSDQRGAADEFAELRRRGMLVAERNGGGSISSRGSRASSREARMEALVDMRLLRKEKQANRVLADIEEEEKRRQRIIEEEEKRRQEEERRRQIRIEEEERRRQAMMEEEERQRRRQKEDMEFRLKEELLGEKIRLLEALERGDLEEVLDRDDRGEKDPRIRSGQEANPADMTNWSSEVKRWESMAAEEVKRRSFAFRHSDVNAGNEFARMPLKPEQVEVERKPKDEGPREMNNDKIEEKSERTRGGETNEMAPGEGRMERYMAELAKNSVRSRLPTLQLKVFEGKVEDFPLFIQDFESWCGSEVISAGEKLAYLGQYTKGEPHDMIKACMYMGKTEGYKRARYLLQQRYGQPERVGQAYIDRLLSFKAIERNNSKDLDKFSMLLEEVKSALQGCSYGMEALKTPGTLGKMLGKLPFGLRDRWRRYRLGEKERGREVGFDEFVGFVGREALSSNDPLYSEEILRAQQQQPKSERQSEQNQNPRARVMAVCDRLVCSDCDGDHHIRECPTFTGRPVRGRLWRAREVRLCFRCLEPGHMLNRCEKQVVCEKCQGPHAILLHGAWDRSRRFSDTRDDRSRQWGAQGGQIQRRWSENAGKSGGGTNGRSHAAVGSGAPVWSGPRGYVERGDVRGEQGSVRSGNIGGVSGNFPHTEGGGNPGSSVGNRAAINRVTVGMTNGAMSVVPVVVNCQDREILDGAFLDNGSSVSFITWEAVERLGISPRLVKQVSVKVSTLTGTHEMSCGLLAGVSVRGEDLADMVALPPLYVIGRIPVEIGNAFRPEDVVKHDHLRDLPLKQVPKVNLMLGSNAVGALEPLELRSSPGSGAPYAFRTRVGWIVSGCGDQSESYKGVFRVVARIDGELDAVVTNGEADDKPDVENCEHGFGMLDEVTDLNTPSFKEAEVMAKKKRGEKFKQKQKCVEKLFLDCHKMWNNQSGSRQDFCKYYRSAQNSSNGDVVQWKPSRCTNFVVGKARDPWPLSDSDESVQSPIHRVSGTFDFESPVSRNDVALVHKKNVCNIRKTLEGISKIFPRPSQGLAGVPFGNLGHTCDVYHANLLQWILSKEERVVSACPCRAIGGVHVAKWQSGNDFRKITSGQTLLGIEDGKCDCDSHGKLPFSSVPSESVAELKDVQTCVKCYRPFSGACLLSDHCRKKFNAGSNDSKRHVFGNYTENVSGPLQGFFGSRTWSL